MKLEAIDHKQRRILLIACGSALLIFLIGLAGMGLRRNSAPPPLPMSSSALRVLPKAFPAGTHLPDTGEGETSGSIDLGTFSPGRDLVYIDDDRVWWESDHDKNDTEDDHTVHQSLVAPFRLLADHVAARGGTLEVHDAYRPSGVHNPTSLHKEGRAVDVTCDQFPLDELAKLCWISGFDWVLHEGGNGPHIHASVKR